MLQGHHVCPVKQAWQAPVEMPYIYASAVASHVVAVVVVAVSVVVVVVVAVVVIVVVAVAVVVVGFTHR